MTDAPAAQQGTDEAGIGRGGSALAPAPAGTKFAMFVDRTTIESITNSEPIEPDPFPVIDPFPPLDEIHPDDLLYVGTVTASSREAAVKILLLEEDPSDRLKLLQMADDAAVSLNFVGVPVSNMRDVPVGVEMVPVRRIGR